MALAGTPAVAAVEVAGKAAAVVAPMKTTAAVTAVVAEAVLRTRHPIQLPMFCTPQVTNLVTVLLLSDTS